MSQIYKIYMNQSALVVADFEPNLEANTQVVDYEYIDINKLYKQSNKVSAPKVYWCMVSDPSHSFEILIQKLRMIRAAGGLVKNGKGAYLFIYRLGKWDLPKGKIDEGEKTKEAAKREVEEECGIEVDYLGPKLISTYHLYTIKEDLVIKKTCWYEMGVNKSPKLIPQLEEDITRAEWRSPTDLKEIRENTYPLIHDILAFVR
jgi:8-oxo-dGTP pyrophosphatase MutT (NUDIX family)